MESVECISKITRSNEDAHDYRNPFSGVEDRLQQVLTAICA